MFNLQMITPLLITSAAFIINVPCGYLRSRQRRFSALWFIYLHLSVPLIFLVRVLSHTGSEFIALFIVAAVAGQYLGGKLRDR
jgi:hypothetical protein